MDIGDSTNRLLIGLSIITSFYGNGNIYFVIILRKCFLIIEGKFLKLCFGSFAEESLLK